MLLIQSQANDQSTNDMLDWFYYLYPEREVLRLNDASYIDQISYGIDDKEQHLFIRCGDKKLNSDDIDNRWYRRGHFAFKHEITISESDNKEEQLLFQNVAQRFRPEINALLHIVDLTLGKNEKSINKFGDNNQSKINQLLQARDAGLSIPPSLLTNKAEDILAFAERYGRIITKANLDNAFVINWGRVNLGFAIDTYLYTPEDIRAFHKYKDTISPIPALFQKYIEKWIELRIFYLNGKCYAAAIFSQANERTKIDYRNYDENRPNRCVPFTLPEEIAKSINTFMKLIDMNCGSIDMILTPNHEYVFLEVNPIGQYQWIAINCNYPIDRDIATFLMEGL